MWTLLQGIGEYGRWVRDRMAGSVGVTAGPAQLRQELQPGVAARANFIKY